MGDFKVIRSDGYEVSKWSGGETTQLMLWPADGDYASRRFEWRISTATVEVEESDFSDLTGFERWLMILEGRMELFHGDVHGEGKEAADNGVVLTPYHEYRFDGGLKTKSKGTAKDFNLMTGPGWRGKLIPIEKRMTYVVDTPATDFHLFIHCQMGDVEIDDGYNHVIITNNESTYSQCVSTNQPINLKSTDENSFSAAVCLIWKSE